MTHTNGSIGLKIDEKLMRQSAAQISNMGKLKIHFGHGKAVENGTWVKG